MATLTWAARQTWAPSQAKQIVESADASWADREWNFWVHVFSGVLDVDGYREQDDGGIGQRVKGTVNGTVTAYVGDWFEWSGSVETVKRYYISE